MIVSNLKCIICGTYENLGSFPVKTFNVEPHRRSVRYETSFHGHVPLCYDCRKKVVKYNSKHNKVYCLGVGACGPAFLLTAILAYVGGLLFATPTIIICLCLIAIMAVFQGLAISRGTNLMRYIELKKGKIYVINQSDFTRQPYSSWERSVKIEREKKSISELSQEFVNIPEQAIALFREAVSFRQVGRYNEALLSLDKALKLYPNYAEAHSERGGVLISLGRFEEAFSELTKALEIEPDLISAKQRLKMNIFKKFS